MSDRSGSRSTGGTKRRSIRGTIGAHLVALVAIQLALVLGLIGFAALQDFRSERHDAATRVNQTVGLATEYVADVLQETSSTIDLIPQFADLLASPAVCQFTQQQAEEEDLADDGLESEFLLLRRDGRPMCPSPEGMPEASYGSEAWFKEALASTEPVQAGPMVDPSGRHVMIHATYASQSSVVVGIVVDLSAIGERLDQKFASDAAPPSFIVTSADRSTMISSSESARTRPLAGTAFASPLSGQGAAVEDLSGVERIFAEGTVPEMGWHLYAGISTSDALAGARKALRERTVVAVVVIALVMAAAIVIQRRFVRPVRSLVQVTKRFSEGDLTARVEASGPVELAQLGNEFNAMGAIRSEAEAALAKAFKAERRAAEELREIDGMRKAFLMAISHELRTPLTSVVGYASLLQESMDAMPPEEVRVCVNAVAKQSTRLERLLVDLLDIERLSRGSVQPNVKETDVHQLVSNVLVSMHLTDRVSAKVARSTRAWIDAALVERILENLLSNALKHTPDDTPIWVRTSRRNGELQIVVEDAGPGVSDELKERIFKPFEQGEVPEHSPGTGVGLALVAQFAKLHGGRAWVEDRRGGGASFRVALPARPAVVRAKAA